MIVPRPSAQRGRTRLDWLDSRHTFSFGDYHDPAYMGFGPLRVLNEDRVEPGRGFGTHGHRDMEILSFVLSGALEHRDSIGNGSVIHPGEVQRMSAGTGVMHSEHNPSSGAPTHFLQVWILPERRGIEPGYEQRRFSDEERRGKLRLVASRDGRNGSLRIHQDARVHSVLLDAGAGIVHDIDAGRRVWVQMARGAATIGDLAFAAGDGAAVTESRSIGLLATEPSEIILFDLPGT